MEEVQTRNVFIVGDSGPAKNVEELDISKKKIDLLIAPQ